VYSQLSPITIVKERSRSALRQILVCIALVYALLLPTIHFGSNPASGYIALFLIAAPLGCVLWLLVRILRFAANR
jgi:hypothetical protein